MNACVDGSRREKEREGEGEGRRGEQRATQEAGGKIYVEELKENIK